MFELIESIVFLIWSILLNNVFKLYCLPLLISLGLCVGVGIWDFLTNAKDIFFACLIVVLTTIFLMLVKQYFQGLLKFLVTLFCLLIVFYIGTGTCFLQGHMSIGIIASVLQTDQNEALEYLSVLQYKYAFFALTLFALIIYFFYFSKLEYQLKLHKSLIIFVFIFNVFNLFIIQSVKAVVNYKKEEKALYVGNDLQPDWTIEHVEYPYDNQIFIVGESVQRNYLSLYGYRHSTTPFLDSMPLTVVDEYISTAANTATSLPRTLAYMDADKNIHISMNVISLAKQAHYNTVWISNQGFMGKNDTAVSKIAIHAEHQFFLKSGNYMSKNIDDDHLVEILKTQLETYKDKKNIIFIHMMGSHPNACERLFESPLRYKDQPDSINCYLSSINKLDSFIEQVYQVLNKTQRSFNITYFSDHGMSVTTDGVYVDNEFKENYQVPFFVLSSDAKKQNYMHKNVSGYDFMNIYAGMIGVKTRYLDAERSLNRLPSNSGIIVFDWENYIPYRDLK